MKSNQSHCLLHLMLCLDYHGDSPWRKFLIQSSLFRKDHCWDRMPGLFLMKFLPLIHSFATLEVSSRLVGSSFRTIWRKSAMKWRYCRDHHHDDVVVESEEIKGRVQDKQYAEQRRNKKKKTGAKQAKWKARDIKLKYEVRSAFHVQYTLSFILFFTCNVVVVSSSAKKTCTFPSFMISWMLLSFNCKDRIGRILSRLSTESQCKKREKKRENETRKGMHVWQERRLLGVASQGSLEWDVLLQNILQTLLQRNVRFSLLSLLYFAEDTLQSSQDISVVVRVVCVEQFVLKEDGLTSETENWS